MKKGKKDTAIVIRKGQPGDLPDIQKLFVETIRSVCSVDYNEEQIKVWTSSVENKERWNHIMSDQVVLLAQSDEKVVGFSSLGNRNYIDLLYVHKDYQGQGIALKLYEAIEEQAIQFEQTALYSDVSITAKPFFEKVGFTVLRKQTVLRQNIELTNFKMVKKVNPERVLGVK
jgi:putative acetyltransferase